MCVPRSQVPPHGSSHGGTRCVIVLVGARVQQSQADDDWRTFPHPFNEHKLAMFPSNAEIYTFKAQLFGLHERPPGTKLERRLGHSDSTQPRRPTGNILPIRPRRVLCSIPTGVQRSIRIEGFVKAHKLQKRET